MATTESIVTAVNSSLFNNFLTDDGAIARIRDGQTAKSEAFGGLSIPAGATIDGIEVLMEGYAGASDHDAQVGDWISVSNDDGATWSTAQSVTTGLWSTNSGVHAVEQAGGASELWGLSWNATTAAAIRVMMVWSTSGGDAVYLDYVKVRIAYTPLPTITTYTSDDNIIFNNGTLVLKGGTLEIK